MASAIAWLIWGFRALQRAPLKGIDIDISIETDMDMDSDMAISINWGFL